MYRIRAVFNGPADRVHPFYSVGKHTLDEAVLMLLDLQYPLKHAVSVQIQRTVDLRGTTWSTLPTGDWWPTYQHAAGA